MKGHESWIWMPRAGHFCSSVMCRFHLNTCVNGHIVSTVGEYWPDQEIRRIFLKSRILWPKLKFNHEGKLYECKEMSAKELEAFLELKGDAFDDAYLQRFGYKEIGLNRLYETMVFKAQQFKDPCCPYIQEGPCLDMMGYNYAETAMEGHYEMCWKWQELQIK